MVFGFNAGTLNLQGSYSDLATGAIYWYDFSNVNGLGFLPEGDLMETMYYEVVRFDGDYVYLKRTDIESEDLMFIAQALLPEGIEIGTQLKYEMFTYEIL